MNDSEIKIAKKLAMAAVATLASAGSTQINAQALDSLRQDSGIAKKLTSKSALVQQILESGSIDQEGYDRNFDKYDRTVDNKVSIPGLIKIPDLLGKLPE